MLVILALNNAIRWLLVKAELIHIPVKNVERSLLLASCIPQIFHIMFCLRFGSFEVLSHLV
jgi:hypothetical protein